MSITEKYEFETISYGVTGWNGLLTAFMEKVESYLHTRILSTLGETVAAYEAVYSGPAFKCYKAKADHPSTMPAIGLAIEAGDADDEIRIHRDGPITNSSWSWAAGLPFSVRSRRPYPGPSGLRRAPPDHRDPHIGHNAYAHGRSARPRSLCDDNHDHHDHHYIDNELYVHKHYDNQQLHNDDQFQQYNELDDRLNDHIIDDELDDIDNHDKHDHYHHAGMR